MSNSRDRNNDPPAIDQDQDDPFENIDAAFNDDAEAEEDFTSDFDETMNTNPHEPLPRDNLLPARSMIIEQSRRGQRLADENSNLSPGPFLSKA